MELDIKIISHPDFDYEFEMALACIQAGDNAIAECHLLSAVQVSETEFGHGHASAALALEQLAELEEGCKGDPTKACELYQTALGILQQELSVDNPLLLKCAFGLARTKAVLHAHKDAENLYRSIFVTFRRTFGPESLEAASLYSSYSELLDAIGDHDHSRILSELAGEIWHNNGLLGDVPKPKKSLPPSPGSVDPVSASVVLPKSQTYINFANIARQSRNLQEAENLFLKALKYAEEDYGKADHRYEQLLSQVISFYQQDLHRQVTAEQLR